MTACSAGRRISTSRLAVKGKVHKKKAVKKVKKAKAAKAAAAEEVSAAHQRCAFLKPSRTKRGGFMLDLQRLRRTSEYSSPSWSANPSPSAGAATRLEMTRRRPDMLPADDVRQSHPTTRTAATRAWRHACAACSRRRHHAHRDLGVPRGRLPESTEVLSDASGREHNSGSVSSKSTRSDGNRSSSSSRSSAAPSSSSSATPSMPMRLSAPTSWMNRRLLRVARSCGPSSSRRSPSIPSTTASASAPTCSSRSSTPLCCAAAPTSSWRWPRTTRRRCAFTASATSTSSMPPSSCRASSRPAAISLSRASSSL